MSSAEILGAAARADVCLVLEGTYPYVRGGVSTWVHQLIGSLADLKFAVVHIGSERNTHTRLPYMIPTNVVGLSDLYCREPLRRGNDPASFLRAARAERQLHADAKRGSRVLDGIRKLHLGDPADPSLLDDFASCDLSVGAFLHGRASYELTQELYEKLAPDTSFLSFFWHLRSMHLPIVRLLSAGPPAAAVYHALCTGYAGLLAAVWSHRVGRPFLLTEHGIYVRERKLELDRAVWVGANGDPDLAGEPDTPLDSATATALHRMWTNYFHALARCAYARASAVISLSEVSRRRQIADGASPERTRVVPNGIDPEAFRAKLGSFAVRSAPRDRVRVGFVGRVVPIKDIVTFIHACFHAVRLAEIDVRIFGPLEEDPPYVSRCRRLVTLLGLEHAIRFESDVTVERIYSQIDMLVLTSFSEGQPLVILEAGAAGIPVVASDAGACRELLEGRTGPDRELGASGIVTSLASAAETADAIVRLAHDPELRRTMGAAGRKRVAMFYRDSVTVSSYRALYKEGAWRASVGASSA